MKNREESVSKKLDDKGDCSSKPIGEAKRWDLQAITMRLFLFFFPFFLAVVFVMGMYFIYDWPAFTVVGGGVFAYFFPPLGKETIIPFVVNTLSLPKHGFTPLAAILSASISIALVDSIVGLFLMWNFDLALKIPLIGPVIKKMENKGGEYLKNKPGIRKAAFVGVALFVLVPFQGSGGVGGTILGRIIGMKKERVWYAINCGAFGGCLVMAVAGFYIWDAMLKTFGSATFQILGVVILVGLIVWAVYSLWYKKRNDETESEPEYGCTRERQ